MFFIKCDKSKVQDVIEEKNIYIYVLFTHIIHIYFNNCFILYYAYKCCFN